MDVRSSCAGSGVGVRGPVHGDGARAPAQGEGRGGPVHAHAAGDRVRRRLPVGPGGPQSGDRGPAPVAGIQTQAVLLSAGIAAAVGVLGAIMLVWLARRSPARAAVAAPLVVVLSVA